MKLVLTPISQAKDQKEISLVEFVSKAIYKASDDIVIVDTVPYSLSKVTVKCAATEMQEKLEELINQQSLEIEQLKKDVLELQNKKA